MKVQGYKANNSAFKGIYTINIPRATFNFDEELAEASFRVAYDVVKEGMTDKFSNKIALKIGLSKQKPLLYLGTPSDVYLKPVLNEKEGHDLSWLKKTLVNDFKVSSSEIEDAFFEDYDNFNLGIMTGNEKNKYIGITGEIKNNAKKWVDNIVKNKKETSPNWESTDEDNYFLSNVGLYIKSRDEFLKMEATMDLKPVFIAETLEEFPRIYKIISDLDQGKAVLKSK